MEEKILKEIVSTLQNIEGKEVDTFWIENKLDKIIDLLEKQCEISERIEETLDVINSNMPDSVSISTSSIENTLDSINDKLSDIDSNLDRIDSNTSNL